VDQNPNPPSSWKATIITVTILLLLGCVGLYYASAYVSASAASHPNFWMVALVTALIALALGIWGAYKLIRFLFLFALGQSGKEYPEPVAHELAEKRRGEKKDEKHEGKVIVQKRWNFWNILLAIVGLTALIMLYVQYGNHMLWAGIVTLILLLIIWRLARNKEGKTNVWKVIVLAFVLFYFEFFFTIMALKAYDPEALRAFEPGTASANVGALYPAYKAVRCDDDNNKAQKDFWVGEVTTINLDSGGRGESEGCYGWRIILPADCASKLTCFLFKSQAPDDYASMWCDTWDHPAPIRNYHAAHFARSDSDEDLRTGGDFRGCGAPGTESGGIRFAGRGQVCVAVLDPKEVEAKHINLNAFICKPPDPKA